MYCEKCKRLYSEGQFCVTCGKKLEEVAERKNIKLPVIIAIIGIVLMGLSYIYEVFFSEGPGMMSGFILLVLPIVIFIGSLPFIGVIGIYIDKKNAKTKKAHRKSSVLIIILYIIGILEMIGFGFKGIPVIITCLVGSIVAFSDYMNNK